MNLTKIEKVALLLATIALLVLMLYLPWYRYVIMFFITVPLAMAIVLWLSGKMTILTRDWEVRDTIKAGSKMRWLSVDAIEDIVHNNPRVIKSIGDGTFTTHSLRSGEVQPQLPPGASVNLPDYVSISSLRLKDSMKEILLGIGDGGKPLYLDFTKFVHTVIAGETGGGKSNLAQVLITQLILCDEDINIEIMDMGSNTFSDYNLPCARDVRGAEAVFTRWVSEFEKRRDIFDNSKDQYGLTVKDIQTYNEGRDEPMPYSVLFIEEGADLFSSAIVVDLLGQLLRKARKCGLSIILLTQSASAEDLPTKFRGQFISRIQFPIKEKSLSKMLVGIPLDPNSPKGRGSFSVPGEGDFLVQTPEITAELILKAQAHISDGVTVSVPHTEVVDLNSYQEVETEVGQSKDVWPSAEGKTVKERFEDFANKLRDNGIDPVGLKPAAVVTHLGLNGNGREYRQWDVVIKNGLAK